MWDWLGDLFGGIGDAASGAAGAVGDAAGSFKDFAGGLFGGGGPEQLAGPGAEGASAAGAGASAGDWASRLWGGAGDVAGGFGKFAKGALPFAQLGATGLGVANSLKAQQAAAENSKRVKEAFALQERAAVPLTNFGEAQLKNAQAGNVPTAVQAQIDQWAQGAKVKARDYLARAGIGDSSAAAQWDAYIDQQAQAMKAQALSAESQQGIDALGKGANVASGIGGQAGQQQTSLEALIAAANQQLGRLSGAAA